MKLVKSLIAVAVAACAMNANAALTFSQAAAAGPVSGGPLTFQPGAINTVANATGSVTNVRTTPLGLGATDPYSVISIGGSATLSFSTAASSFSFLWGSPDLGNVIDIVTTDFGTVSKNGNDLLTLAGISTAQQGVNANTRVFTITGTGGTLINSITFKSSNIAFEVATAPIPEPETYALMLAGLGAVGFMARRRRSAQASA
jgi:hypothetical protein